MGNKDDSVKSRSRLHKLPPRQFLINSSSPRTVPTNRVYRQDMKRIPIVGYPPSCVYELIYFLHLGETDPVLVAERKGMSFDLVDIRRFETLDNKQIEMLNAIQHPNFVTVHGIYRTEDECYVAYEHMPRSLEEALGNPYLDDHGLAAIVGQVRCLEIVCRGSS